MIPLASDPEFPQSAAAQLLRHRNLGACFAAGRGSAVTGELMSGFGAFPSLQRVSGEGPFTHPLQTSVSSDGGSGAQQQSVQFSV
jgi:hypothetical protein